MYVGAILLPLLGSLSAGLWGRLLHDNFSRIVTTILMGGASVLSWLLFNHVALQGHTETIHLLTWLAVGDLQADWSLHFDTLSVTMVAIVNTVSFMVHLYAIGYMSHDPTVPRFMTYLSLFTFMMLMLVTGDNLLQIFFGWEGVGLASYLLIGYWYEKPTANKAAVKAFIVNRIADCGLVLALGALFYLFKSLHIATILSHAHEQQLAVFRFWHYDINAIEVICLLLLVGAMGKSAQLGLHTWLPDAMEGPTPVSALIHAATMVTAGVFLIARLSPLFELAPMARMAVTIVGALTALFAATVALTQNDIKRIIAYSTCSQLGYMFFAAGLSAYNLSIFHLATHAFFKALLFLGAGSVIHALADEQDIRKMGGLWRKIPVTFAFMLVGSLALTGIPFFAGYYSKDLILEAAWENGTTVGHFAFWVGITVAFLTALYSWRLLYTVFMGKPRAERHTTDHVHDPGMTMLLPQLVLTVGALFAGMVGKDYILNADFWNQSLVLFSHSTHRVVSLIERLPVIAAMGGILLATLFYVLFPSIPNKLSLWFSRIYKFFHNKWYFDELYQMLIIKPVLKIGQLFWQRGDVKIIDYYGPDGITRWAERMAQRVSTLQSGYIYHYALVMIVGVVATVTWLLVTCS